MKCHYNLDKSLNALLALTFSLDNLVQSESSFTVVSLSPTSMHTWFEAKTRAHSQSCCRKGTVKGGVGGSISIWSTRLESSGK